MSTKPRSPVAVPIRAAFLRAVRGIAKEPNASVDDYSGKTLSEIMRMEIGKHGLLTVMGMLGKYIERESTVKVSGTVAHNHQHGAVSDTTAFLAGVLGAGQTDSPAEPGEERPILPH